ncbi:MAG: hypothetical protein EA357_08880 [Micavibrio sp.]|nr:MAG: hypothetical protein EA357_08880 [Micavibrio sp.]
MTDAYAIGKTLIFFDPALPAARASSILREVGGDKEEDSVAAGNLPYRPPEDTEEVERRNLKFSETFSAAVPGFVPAERDRAAYLEDAVARLGLTQEQAEKKFARDIALQLLPPDGSYAVFVVFEDETVRAFFSVRRLKTIAQMDEMLAAFRTVFENLERITGFKAYDCGARKFLERAEDHEAFARQSAKAAEEMIRFWQRYDSRMRFVRSTFHFLNLTVLFAAALLFYLGTYFGGLVKDVIEGEVLRYRVEAKPPPESRGMFAHYRIEGVVLETETRHPLSVTRRIYGAAEIGETIPVHATGQEHKPFITQEEYRKFSPVYNWGFAHVNSLGFFALFLVGMILLVYRRYLRLAADSRDMMVASAVRGYIWIGLAVLLGGGYTILRMF